RKLAFVKGTRLLYQKEEFGTPKNNTDAMMDFMMSMGASKKPDNDTEYGLGLGQIRMLRGDDLHAQGHEGQGIVIAVLDAGFFKVDDITTFDQTREGGRLLGVLDFVHNGTFIYEDAMHGMNVLSCMASYAPGKMIGTAPKASYW